jgi:DNA topoisomerase-1
VRLLVRKLPFAIEVREPMSNQLVIVESPAKVKTIKKFLGTGVGVDASGGHVRDLPKSQLGIDPEHDFEPHYITIRGKGDTLAKLRKEVKKADKIFLATDPDREGEAISWHLMKALKLDEQPGKTVSRISFNEITKNVVKASLKTPRALDMNLVDAQQARRILDRFVGYLISPLLWEKVKRGLSAGRVQSAALRMVCDREEEINSFVPEEYWNLDVTLAPAGSIAKGPAGKGAAGKGAAKTAGKATGKTILAHLVSDGDGKPNITSEPGMQQVTAAIQGKPFTVTEVRRGERTRKAPLPFTTSTLQQEASKTLNFSTQKTMRVAQQLYEGVDIKGQGTVGLITYLRTDSTRISDEADATARGYVEQHYGARYVAGKTSAGTSAGNIQDAHEAIRPTDVALTPANVKDEIGRDQFRLYQLIWKRFVASRMQPAQYETLSVRFAAGGYVFAAAASKQVFDGFLSVYVDDEAGEEGGGYLEGCAVGMEYMAEEILPSQHFTQPPAHFTEAALVRAMEEQGIGRPSTYAPTITLLLARRYVTKEKKNLFVTEVGEVVNRIMKENFPDIVDLQFTANMETKLDSVSVGETHWKDVVRDFYPGLHKAVEEAKKSLESVKIADEETEEVCELCGRRMVIKYGPHGKFLACPGFPECRNTKPFFEKTGIPCPLCGAGTAAGGAAAGDDMPAAGGAMTGGAVGVDGGIKGDGGGAGFAGQGVTPGHGAAHGEVVIKKSKNGRKYYGCSNPDCKFISWDRPSVQRCPQCGGYMVEKGGKLLCQNQDCKYRMDAAASDGTAR